MNEAPPCFFASVPIIRFLIIIVIGCDAQREVFPYLCRLNEKIELQ